jgi:hypothetical protein
MIGYDPKSGVHPVSGYNVSTSSSPYVVQRWPSNAVYNSAVFPDVVYPYYQNNISGNVFQWYMNKDYQIICAGLDNKFGTRYSVPFDAPNFSLTASSSNQSGDMIYGYDNQTNFSTPTIENTK